MTSSPWPTLSNSKATCSAEVPLLKPEQCSAPQYFAKSFSNCAVSGPRQNEQLSSVLAMTASRSLRSERICAGRSKYGIGSAIFFLLLKKVRDTVHEPDCFARAIRLQKAQSLLWKPLKIRA